MWCVTRILLAECDVVERRGRYTFIRRDCALCSVATPSPEAEAIERKSCQSQRQLECPPRLVASRLLPLRQTMQGPAARTAMPYAVSCSLFASRRPSALRTAIQIGTCRSKNLPAETRERTVAALAASLFGTTPSSLKASSVDRLAGKPFSGYVLDR